MHIQLDIVIMDLQLLMTPYKSFKCVYRGTLIYNVLEYLKIENLKKLSRD